jgi:flagellar motor switch protein FliN
MADKTSVMTTDLKTILKLRVPVIVRVGQRHMPMDDVLALGPGAILEMDKPADEELDLLINNKAIGSGTAVKVGENFGIRITAIGSHRERVEALGGA